MPIRTYNTFYRGVSQDDFLSGGANFIDSKNLDGLRGGYFTTLGPKVNKEIITTDKITGFLDGNGDNNYVGTKNGAIYNLSTASDFTPSYTIQDEPTWSVVGGVRFFSEYLFFYKPEDGGNMQVARIDDVDADNDNWVGNIDETWDDGSGPAGKVPYLIYGDILIYSLTSSSIRTVSSSFVQDSFGFIDSYVVGYSLQGTTIKVYCSSGTVYFWDGISPSYSSSQNYGFEIENVVSIGAIDYVTSEAGDFYAVSGYATPTRISKFQQSRRLEDNSDYQNKLDFEEATERSTTLETTRQDIYALAGKDANPGIYKFGRLFPGLQQGFHKIVTQDEDGNDFDEVAVIQFDNSDKKVYFGHTIGSTYTCSSIDTTSLETSKEGYGVTDVFSGGTPFLKEINNIRIATSYTAEDNYIKLYYRINNGVWEELRNINEENDTIVYEQLSKLENQDAFKQFVDIQFKVEFHNETQDDTPPLLHELRIDYDVIEANGG